jgi:tRNA dimethylallyltransferase
VSAGAPAHLAVVGPTASGKTVLALDVARVRGDVEIISVDSMSVYREMDIGTAKPTLAERAEVPHHLIDVADPAEDFSVARYQTLAREALAAIEASGRRAILVGGTGLYLQALIDGFTVPGQYPDVRARLEAEPGTAALYARLARIDPEAAARMEPTNRRRVVRALEVCLGSGRPFSSFGPGVDAFPPTTSFRMVGLDVERWDLDARIADRYRAQLAAGFVDEVAVLARRPGGLSRTASQALGYKELLAHVRGKCSLEDAVDLAVRRTRRFARRQQRWFRRDPRIQWLNPVAARAAVLEDWT